MRLFVKTLPVPMYLILITFLSFSCSPDTELFDENSLENTTEDVAESPDAAEDDDSSSEDDSTTLSADITYWKDLFDKRWAEERPEAIELSLSKGMRQEYYFLTYYVDGLVSIWQATGDNKYLDEVLLIINNTLKDAVPFETGIFVGYEGWPVNTDNNWGWALWDSYYWRNVVTLMRIFHQLEDSETKALYQQEFDKLFAFTERNIWDRYNTNQRDFVYRVNTHMSSHWARIGMEMYLITGEDKYREVFDNISNGTMLGKPANSNIRRQIFQNPEDSKGYAWLRDFDSRGIVQDTDHAGDVVSFIVTAYENGMYWEKEDVNAILATAKNVVWTEDDPSDNTIWATKYVDGSGELVSHRFKNDWMKLGRFDQEFQQKIKRHSPDYRYFGSQLAGIGALNSVILHEIK